MRTVAEEMARLLDKPPPLVPASVRARLKACSEMIAGGKPVELLNRVGCTDPTVSNLLEILSREAGADDPSARLFVERTIDLLCMQLLRHHSAFNAVRTPPRPRRGLARWQVKLVTTYMRDHLDQEVGLDDLAKLVHLSRFHFCTAFRLATGRTPHEWLVAQRIERARDLLAQTVLPVAEVGLAVGYVTPSSFAASFRKLVGATPTEFRRGL
jgi:AraC family transcriptional regulator